MEEQWFENAPGPESFWLKIFQACNNRRTWRHIHARCGKGGALLEIGVGNGALLHYFQNLGFQVQGCDLSRSACDYVGKVYGIKVHGCALGDMNPKEKYDVIVMNHVLEHVEDPVKFLSQARDRLKPHGILHLAVPNVSSWEARFPAWNAYEPYHLLYFSADTLQQALEKAGLRVLMRTTHESFSAWFLLFMRSILKTHQKTAAVRKANQQLQKTGLIEHVYRMAMVMSGFATYPLRLVQAGLGFGDELAVVAVKGK